MNYFSDIRFLKCGEIRFYEECNKRRFADYYGIQYNHSGELVLQIDRETPVSVKEPCFFVSGPGKLITYGAPPRQTRHHLFLCFHQFHIVRCFRKLTLVIVQQFLLQFVGCLLYSHQIWE